jgi:hypothetical protein
MIRSMRIGRSYSTNRVKRNACRILMGSQKEKDHYKEADLGGWIILKLISEKWDDVV